MSPRATHLRSAALLALLLAALLVQAAPAQAAPPPNDPRAAPALVGALPALVRGTTVEATLDEDEPPSPCGQLAPSKGSVWYALNATAARDLLVALDAAGDMDASIDVFERTRSQVTGIACARTNRRGEATAEFAARAGTSYLIRVAPLANSVQAGFALRVVAPEPPARPPGAALPAGGATGQVDRFGNADDAWAVTLRAGRTYRFNLVTPGRGCARGALYAPGAAFDGDAVKPLRCDAQTAFTPESNGRYAVYVQAPRASRAVIAYRLRAGRALRDDTAPGMELANDRRVGGRLDGAELDALDLYRFSVTRRSDLEVRLRTTHDFDVALLSAGGRRISGGGTRLDSRIRPGRYFIAVRARNGAAGRYTLSRLTRTITRARTLVDGARGVSVPVGATVQLGLRVRPAVDGRATLTVERFDPLAGWLFDARVRPRVRAGAATVAFRPPTVGRWRVTGSYDGTRRASPSSGGIARLQVTEPPTDD